MAFDPKKPTTQMLGRWHDMINNFIGESYGLIRLSMDKQNT